jgi:hypothetical protein
VSCPNDLRGAPDKVRVCYEETDCGHQGRLSDGRVFVAYTTGAAPAGGHNVDRIVAVLHLFDTDGSHLRTESRLGGLCQNWETYREDRDRAGEVADRALTELLATLAQFAPCYERVDVRPFEVQIEGVEYGFVYRVMGDDERTDEYVIHMPRHHWYHAPWTTGEYDT